MQASFLLRMKRLRSWINPKVAVSNPAIHGKGLFAKRRIKKGEKVLIYGGEKIDRNFAYWVDQNVGDYLIQVDDSYHLGPVRKKEIKSVHVINHSCSPNVGFSNSNTLIAIRDIKTGEELTFDYAMCTSDGYYLICKCGSKDCRKVITGDDWLRKELQKKYAGYFSPYLAEKIRKLSSH